MRFDADGHGGLGFGSFRLFGVAPRWQQLGRWRRRSRRCGRLVPDEYCCRLNHFLLAPAACIVWLQGRLLGKGRERRARHPRLANHGGGRFRLGLAAGAAAGAAAAAAGGRVRGCGHKRSCAAARWLVAWRIAEVAARDRAQVGELAPTTDPVLARRHAVRKGGLEALPLYVQSLLHALNALRRVGRAPMDLGKK